MATVRIGKRRAALLMAYRKAPLTDEDAQRLSGLTPAQFETALAAALHDGQLDISPPSGTRWLNGYGFDDLAAWEAKHGEEL